MGDTRPVDDILAELLGGEQEGFDSAGSGAACFASSGLGATRRVSDAAGETALTNATAAAAAADALAANQCASILQDTFPTPAAAPPPAAWLGSAKTLPAVAPTVLSTQSTGAAAPAAADSPQRPDAALPPVTSTVAARAQQQQGSRGTPDLDSLLSELLSAPLQPTAAPPAATHLKSTQAMPAADSQMVAPITGANSQQQHASSALPLIYLNDLFSTPGLAEQSTEGSAAGTAAAGSDPFESEAADMQTALGSTASDAAQANAAIRPAAAPADAAATGNSAAGVDTAAAAAATTASEAAADCFDSDKDSDLLLDLAEVLQAAAPANHVVAPAAPRTQAQAQAAPIAPPGAAAADSSRHAAAAPGSLHGIAGNGQQQQHQQQHSTPDMQQDDTQQQLEAYNQQATKQKERRLQQQQQQPHQQQEHRLQQQQQSQQHQQQRLPPTGLPAHEVALQHAWEYEEALYKGKLSAEADIGHSTDDSSNAGEAGWQQLQQKAKGSRVNLDPLQRLNSLLADAPKDWNPAGRPDASGAAMIGGSVLLKLESLAGLFAAGTPSGSKGGSGGGGGIDWAQVLIAAMAPHGQMQSVASSSQYLAIGTATGTTLVFQLPQPGQNHQGQHSTQSHTNMQLHSSGSHSTLPGGAAMWHLSLGEGLGGDSVTCLGFSLVTSPTEPLWLAVGHQSGAMTMWELQKRGPKQVAGIAQHGTSITLASFFPGKSTSLLLSGDERGRLCLHTFNNLLLRTNVSSKVLCNGQYGALLSISHLAPFGMPAPVTNTTAYSNNASISAVQAILGMGLGQQGSKSPAQTQGGSKRGSITPPLSPRDAGKAAAGDDAANKALVEDAGWRVGEGVFCLTTSTHCYIARLKFSTSDLVMLYSIPKPSQAPQAATAAPSAAWLPHHRKAAAGYRVQGDVVIPTAVLALGWGDRLVLFDVPLVGDHIILTAPDAAEPLQSPGPALAAAAAAAAGQLRRVGAGNFTRQQQQQQRASQTIEALNPTTAAQVASQFSLSIATSWTGGSDKHGRTESNDQHNGPSEPLPVLGVHWLDADALAVVCDQGFSSLLLVLGFSIDSAAATAAAGDNDSNGAGSSHNLRLKVQEQVEWMDQPVTRASSVAVGVDCSVSVVGSGPRVYLLGQAGGTFCGRLMPWSERLKTLQDVGKHKLGLYYALCFQQQQQHRQGSHPGVIQQQQQQPAAPLAAVPAADSNSSGGGSAGRRSSVGGFARSQGFGAEPRQLEQWMLSLMLGYASTALQQAATAAAAAALIRSSLSAAADVCVCTCLLLQRPDVLWARVYPLFAQWEPPPPAAAAASPAAAPTTAAARPGNAAAVSDGCLNTAAAAAGVGVLLESIEQAVLSDLVEGLPPEIMQALVDHFASIGAPERVEGCVLHLSITSLDLDQVIRLCEASGLYSALTYISTRISDYRRPLLALLAGIAAATAAPLPKAPNSHNRTQQPEALRCCYKALVYLRCCFQGMAFPPGSGTLTMSPVGALDTVKATLLGSLLFLDRNDLIREWHLAGGRSATAAALLAAAPAAGSRRNGLGTSQQQQQAATSGVMAITDPHPALQLLLSVDVSAVMAVLSEATFGWDAVETDLRAAAGKPAEQLESVLVATQVVVNAVVALLEAGRFQECHTSSQNSSSTSTGMHSSGATVALEYVIHLLAAGRVTVKPSFVLVLLQHIVNQAASTALDAVKAILQQQFVDIINVVGINLPGSSPEQQQQSPGGHSQQHQAGATPYDPAALSVQQAQQALQLASNAGFLLAAAAIHHAQEHYAAALQQYITLANKQLTQEQEQPQLQQPPSQHVDLLFSYIDKFLSSNDNSSSNSKAQTSRRAFLKAVLQQTVPLVRLNPAAAAALLLKHMSEQQVPVLLSLQQQPQLQFDFLKMSMRQAQALQSAQRAAAAAALGLGTQLTAATASSHQSSAAGGSAADAVTSATAAAAAERLLERSEVADMFVKLLAQFEPQGVLPFLQSHHNYNITAAIQACAAHGVSDGEAFLHERLGDVDAALQLHLNTLTAANVKLQAALAAGQLPLLQLQDTTLQKLGQLQVAADSSNTYYSSSSSSVGSMQADGGAGIQWGLGPLLDKLRAAQAEHQTATDSACAAGDAINSVQQAARAIAVSLLQTLHSKLVAAAGCGADVTSSHGAVRSASGQLLGHCLTHQGSSGFRSVGSSGNAVADVHQAWMAELSPRLRLRGLGHNRAVNTLSGGRTATASRMAADGKQEATTAAGAAIAVPAELVSCWTALQAAIAFCKRNCRSSSGSSGSSRRVSSSTSARQHDDGQQLWYQVTDVCAAQLRSAQERLTGTALDGASNRQADSTQQQQQQHKSQQQQLLPSLAAAASGQLPLQDLPSLLRAAAVTIATAAAADLFRLLLDELVSEMADHLPLLDIVGWVLQQHGSERFGEFRSVLLELFGATAYESAIMAAANRLITADAFTAVQKAYILHQLAREVAEQQQQQQARPSAATGAGSSSSNSNSSNLVGRSVALGVSDDASIWADETTTAVGMTFSVPSPVLTAHQLGLLGSSSDNTTQGSSSYQLMAEATQRTAGRLQPGVVGLSSLQLRPSGPAASHLQGVAAEYKTALQAARGSNKVYRGEIDLAYEIAASHQQHYADARDASQQQQQAQHPDNDSRDWTQPTVAAAAAAGAHNIALQAQHQHQQQNLGSNTPATDAAIGATTAGRDSSFDIDELLLWSKSNL